MVLFNWPRVLALLIFLTKLSKVSGTVTLDLREYEELCDKITEEPNFSTDMLIGKKWKPYYTWNLPMEHRCIDIIFKYAAPLAKQYVPKAMQSMIKSMADQNNHKQVLYMYMTPPALQTVLVADPSGIPGRFLQMGQLSRSQYCRRAEATIIGATISCGLLPTEESGHHSWIVFTAFHQAEQSHFVLRSDKKTRMLTKMAFKVLQEGQYVIMSDCGIGSTFLLVRQDMSDQEPEWQRIIALAETLHVSLPLGHGSQACSFRI